MGYGIPDGDDVTIEYFYTHLMDELISMEHVLKDINVTLVNLKNMLTISEDGKN